MQFATSSISGIRSKMQRRRRFRKPGTTYSSSFALLEKELREAHLESLLRTRQPGPASRRQVVADDPFFPRLTNHASVTGAEDVTNLGQINEDTLAKEPVAVDKYRRRVQEILSSEEQERLWKEMTSHAHFVQQIVLSTIFCDN